MINPNELRIGNFIQADVNQFDEVINIDGESGVIRVKTGNEFYLTSSFINGIPLTPEWLERCGFEKSYSAYLNGIIYMYEGPGYWNNQKGWPVGIRDEVSMRIVRCIEYVHQLQNLYFALTGEELTIKETV